MTRLVILLMLLVAHDAMAGLLDSLLLRRRVPATTASSGYTPQQSSSLLFWYDFSDGGTTNGSYLDSSAAGNNGTQATTSARGAWTNVSGNYCLYVDGSDDWFKTISTSVGAGLTNLTLSGWVNLTQWTEIWQTWISDGREYSALFQMSADDWSAFAHFINGNRSYWSTKSIYGWHFWAMSTVDNTTWYFMLDSNVVSTFYAPGANATPGGGWEIGRRSSTYPRRWKGFIDRVQLRSVGLTTNELLLEYQAGR